MIKSILKSALLVSAAALAPLAITPSAMAEVPLEVYAELPRTASVRISPDGKRVAMLSPYKGEKKIFVYSLEDPNAKTIVIPTPENSIIKGLSWVSDSHVAMFARFPQGKGKYLRLMPRWVTTNVDTKKSVVMLENEINSGDMNSTSSPFGGYIANELPLEPSHILMGWGTEGKTQHYKVNLNTGKSGVFRTLPLKTSTILNVEGDKELLRIRNSRNTGKFDVLAPDDNGVFKTIWTRTTDPEKIREFGLFGLTNDKSKVILRDVVNGRNVLQTIDMKTGAVGPLDIDLSQVPKGTDYGPVRDSISRDIIGLSYTDDFPQQIFFSDRYRSWHNSAKKAFPGKTVSILSRSRDNKKVSLYVEGPTSGGEFYLFEPAEKRISSLGKSYPELSDSDISKSVRVDFQARDGKTIPAYLMLPPGKTKADGPFPMIAMPHGGPQARDYATFDFWSQFLTSRGYAVFKPQFRGSDGFGRSYVMAGRGEFGGLMVDDTVDGVRQMIKSGIAKPDKICVNGASYGGYQAMALPVREPDMFKCALSVAGVSDLPKMMDSEYDRNGGRKGSVVYWNEVMGDRIEEEDKLATQSPARYVNQIKATMLLVHGENDVTVPISQSNIMSKALKKAGRKDYKVMVLKDDDHNLSLAQSRRELLEASEKFFAEHLK